MDAEARDRGDAVVAVDVVQPARGGSRRRAIGGVVAAMLVAGAGGTGFGLGRSMSDAGGAGADDAIATPTVAPAPNAPVPSTAADTSPSTSVADEGTTATTVPVIDDRPAGDGNSASLAWTEPGWSGVGPLETLTEFTTDDGLRVRVQTGPSGFASMETEDSNGWAPSAFCFGQSQLRVSIDGPDLVDVAQGVAFDALYADIEVPLVAEVGGADGRPMRLLVVQARDGIDDVTATWGDGVSVTGPVRRGVAVLLVDGEGGWSQPYTIDIATPEGDVTVTQADLDHSGDAAWRAACNPPPPALPSPGEQPADPAAARADVEARFALLWDRTVPADDKPDLLDDDTGVDAATAQVFEGGFGSVAESAQHVLEDFVFVSPTRAWFRYGIDTSNGYFGERYGVARLTAEGWIFPRALVCQDLSLAGGTCDPPAEPIFPPDWYDRYSGQCMSVSPDAESGCEVATYDRSAIASW